MTAAALLGGVAAANGLAARRRTQRRRTSLRSERGGGERFDPEAVDELPEVARRYLRHAIEPGTPLARRVDLRMSGQFNLGGRLGWVPFSATETIAIDRGFLWEATVTAPAGLRLSGADHYVDGTGGLRFSAWGVLPIARASGPAVDRSSAGRFLAESFWLPTAFLPRNGAEWEGIDESRARVVVPESGTIEPLTLEIDESGALRSVETMRVRGEQPDEGPIPFGGVVADERTWDGYTIPSRVRAGWRLGTDRAEELFRATIEEASFA